MISIIYTSGMGVEERQEIRQKAKELEARIDDIRDELKTSASAVDGITDDFDNEAMLYIKKQGLQGLASLVKEQKFFSEVFPDVEFMLIKGMDSVQGKVHQAHKNRLHRMANDYMLRIEKVMEKVEELHRDNLEFLTEVMEMTLVSRTREDGNDKAVLYFQDNGGLNRMHVDLLLGLINTSEVSPDRLVEDAKEGRTDIYIVSHPCENIPDLAGALHFAKHIQKEYDSRNPPLLERAFNIMGVTPEGNTLMTLKDEMLERGHAMGLLCDPNSEDIIPPDTYYKKCPTCIVSSARCPKYAEAKQFYDVSVDEKEMPN